MAGSSTVKELPPQHQVFINFRGADLRQGFVSHLVKAFENHHINIFIDDYEDRGQYLDILFRRIEESRIALTIFSDKYTESIWCLRELAKIKDCMDEGKLVAIPIFFKLEPATVRGIRGEFGDNFRNQPKADDRKKWKKALEAIPQIMGIEVKETSKESEKIIEILTAVKKVLNKIPSEGSEKAFVDSFENSKTLTFSGRENDKIFGLKQSLKELGDKLDPNVKETRIIGVVGMPGIGKTTLLRELFKIWRPRFNRRVLIDQIKELDLDCLPILLMEELLGLKDVYIDNFEDPYENYKVKLLERQVLLILDDVSKREHIDALLGRHDWISRGSRIVIATNDMSLLKGLVHDTYVVRQMNHKDSLQLFHYHAFGDDQANLHKEDFMKLSEEFVIFARGHPLALKILGNELCEQNIKHWKDKLAVLAQNHNSNVKSIFQVSYDELTSEQKEAFLDISCFRSQDKDYVESLLASSNPESPEAMSVVKVLANKFLINTCDGRVEMHDLLYTFSRELDSKASTGSRQRRLCLHQDIIKEGDVNILQNNMVRLEVSLFYIGKIFYFSLLAN